MYDNAIYIVNDSPTITEAIVELLKSKGFENISTFKDGREVMKWIRENQPEISTGLKAVEIIEAGVDDYMKKPFDIKSIH